MSPTQTIFLTLIFYNCGLVAIGLLGRRLTRDDVDFYLGGRGLGPTVAAISAAASSSSAWTLLGVSGAAYSFGISALWIFPGCVGGFLLNWLVVAGPLRRISRHTGAITLTQVLSRGGSTAPGRAITVSCSVIILLCMGTYISSQFQGAGKAFGETFGWSPSSGVLAGSAIVILYTLLGGFWAVSLTDALQGLVMAAASIILPSAAIVLAGGLDSFLGGLRSVPVEGYLSLTRGAAPASALGFIFGFLGISLGYPGQPHVVNRFMALKPGPIPLRRARVIAISWAIVVFSGMILLGLAGRVLFADLQDPEVVFLAVANSFFNPVLAGILLAAVLSAIMSTVDSQLLVVASTVTQDLRPAGATAGAGLLRSRLAVFLVSLSAVAAALLGSREIFSQVLFAWSAMGNAFGPLLLMILWKGRVSGRASLAAILLGFTLSVAAYYALPGMQTKGIERVIPFLIGLLVAWSGSGSGQASSASTRPKMEECGILRPE